MAMTLRLTDQETEALRRRAELEGRSMQDVARQAVRGAGHRPVRLRGGETTVHGVRRGRPPLAPPKAAALLHSLARTQPLVEGNERLALAATIAFYGLDGHRLTLSNDETYDLVTAVAVGDLDDVGALAERLRTRTTTRSWRRGVAVDVRRRATGARTGW
jgi:hypothetical protein